MARNRVYLDAPISGGVQGARDGTLVAMVGGAAEVSSGHVRSLCFARKSFILGLSARAT